MNYFELFGIPVSFDLEISILTKKYYALSMQFHPDRFSLKSIEEQDEALNKSTQINEAYRTLKDDQKRIKYILNLYDVEFIEGKERVPQEFLMEMMDINEQLMEYKFDPTEDAALIIRNEIKRIEDTLNKEVSPIFIKFSTKTIKPNDLQVVKSYYLKTQYLNSLKNNLNG